MKILCSRHSNNFERFKGKDIWVKAFDSGYFFMKIIDIQSPHVLYNRFSGWAYSYEEAEKEILNDIIWKDRMEDINIIEPIESYTTSELLEEYK